MSPRRVIVRSGSDIFRPGDIFHRHGLPALRLVRVGHRHHDYIDYECEEIVPEDIDRAERPLWKTVKGWFRR